MREREAITIADFFSASKNRHVGVSTASYVVDMRYEYAIALGAVGGACVALLYARLKCRAHWWFCRYEKKGMAYTEMIYTCKRCGNTKYVEASRKELLDHYGEYYPVDGLN